MADCLKRETATFLFWRCDKCESKSVYATLTDFFLIAPVAWISHSRPFGPHSNLLHESQTPSDAEYVLDYFMKPSHFATHLYCPSFPCVSHTHHTQPPPPSRRPPSSKLLARMLVALLSHFIGRRLTQILFQALKSRSVVAVHPRPASRLPQPRLVSPRSLFREIVINVAKQGVYWIRVLAHPQAMFVFAR